MACAAAAIGLRTDAQDTGCASFQLDGLHIGQERRSVMIAMRGRSEQATVVRAPWGMTSGAAYIDGPNEAHVEYDQPASRRLGRRALVTRVRTLTAGDPRSIVDGLSEAFGEPVAGKQHLATELSGGSVAWVDRACAVIVRAEREKLAWYEPRQQARVVVELAPLDRYPKLAALAPALPEPLPVPQEEPAPEPQAQTSSRTGSAGPERPRPAEAVLNAEDRARRPETRPARRALELPVFETAERASPRDGFSPPVKTKHVDPAYPALARRVRLDKRVELELEVLESGLVGNVQVVEVSVPRVGLERAAIDAARQWAYRPATENGSPIVSWIKVTIAFQ